jgi:catechol-2,3-dioxygenase
MKPVHKLGYAEFNATKIEQELAYYTDIMGATLVETGGDGTHYLSMGIDHHNIALKAASSPSLGVTGFQLCPGYELKAFETLLAEHGIQSRRLTDARPGIPALVEIPEIGGHTLQFYAEMAMPAPGFARTGIVPNRLGHIALMSPEGGKLVEFFSFVLGFHATDWFEEVATFLTCNYDHHVVNILNVPVTKMHHIAFEMRGAAHQYQASDQLARAELPIIWGPSRHTAGHNFASYHYDHEGFLVELYADMDIFVPEQGYFEPRPWHEQMPQRPRVWPLSQLNAWRTEFAADLARA